MTLKNRCVNCDHVIEAPDSMRGREIACPECEATNVLLSLEDARRRSVGVEESESDRQAFLTSLSSARRRRSSSSTSASRAAVPEPRREGLAGQDFAVLASRRLKDISVYLLFFSYALLLAAVACGLGIVVWDGIPPWVRVLGAVGCTLVGLTVFLAFKLQSDTVRALADLTDLGRSVDQRLELLELQALSLQGDREAPATARADAASGQG